MEYSIRHPGEVLSKTMILEHVWDSHFTPQTNAVEGPVHRLQGKVDDDFEPKHIHPVRGVGYVLRLP